MLKRHFREWCNCVYRLGFTWLRIFQNLFSVSGLPGFVPVFNSKYHLSVFCPTWLELHFVYCPIGFARGHHYSNSKLKKKKNCLFDTIYLSKINYFIWVYHNSSWKHHGNIRTGLSSYEYMGAVLVLYFTNTPAKYSRIYRCVFILSI